MAGPGTPSSDCLQGSSPPPLKAVTCKGPLGLGLGLVKVTSVFLSRWSHSFDELTSAWAGRSRSGPSLPASPGFPCLDPRAEQLSSWSAVGPRAEREELGTRGHCQLGLLLVSITLQSGEQSELGPGPARAGLRGFPTPGPSLWPLRGRLPPWEGQACQLYRPRSQALGAGLPDLGPRPALATAGTTRGSLPSLVG